MMAGFAVDFKEILRSKRLLEFRIASQQALSGMPHWLIKSALHRVISCLPASHWWNDLFQKHVTKSLDLGPERFEQRLEYCSRHLKNFFDASPGRTQKFSALELGTGWYPVVPVGFYLSGADNVWTFDIAPLLRRERVIEMLRLFVDFDERGKLKQLLPRVGPERLEKLREILANASNSSTEAILQAMNIHTFVRDAQQTGLPAGSVDLFVSTSVLEYVPRPVFLNILREFRRIAKPGAVTSDFINLLDEFCHFDRSITPFNFLKYTDRQWRWLDSPILFKNRMRVSDFREVYAEAGCPVLSEENTNGLEKDLDTIRLAPEFQRHSRADLLVIRTWFTARISQA